MRGLRHAAVATIAVVAFLVGANPASAAVTTHTSALGAGYKTTPVDGVKTASVKFVVPDITCAHPSGFEALFLGVFALNSDASGLSAFGQASCNSGSKVYFAEVTDGTNPPKTIGISVGDTILARITEDGATRTALVKNLTAKTSASISKSGSNDEAVLIGDFGSQFVPTFSRVHMFQAMVNGDTIGDAPATNRERLKSASDLQINASLLQSGVATFNLIFKSNA